MFLLFSNSIYVFTLFFRKIEKMGVSNSCIGTCDLNNMNEFYLLKALSYYPGHIMRQNHVLYGRLGI